MSGNSVFSLINLKSSPEHYLYLFRSNNDGLKLVVHQYVEQKENRKVYNLGFGLWDEEREVLVDDEVYKWKRWEDGIKHSLSDNSTFFRQLSQ